MNIQSVLYAIENADSIEDLQKIRINVDAAVGASPFGHYPADKRFDFSAFESYYADRLEQILQHGKRTLQV